MSRALRLAAGLLLLGACDVSPPARRGAGGGATPPTTDPAIALGNLEATIQKLEADLAAGRLPPERIPELVEPLLMRGQFLGRVSDYERAAELAESFVRERPTESAARLARASTRATLHLFPGALSDLEQARGLGAPSDKVEPARAAILQALGRYDEALTIRRRHASARPSIASVGAEAALLAEAGRVPEAARRFAAAQAVYRDVSPFPRAWLDFQQGRMWMRAGDLAQARRLFESARAILPQYAAATGHLGEVEAALGHPDRAIALLREAATQSDDPDAAGHLAQVLAEAGRASEAGSWRERAAARYDDLLARHLEAFADHAAEFWLQAGGDARKALRLARRNLEVRRTPASFELLARAERGARPSNAATGS